MLSIIPDKKEQHLRIFVAFPQSPQLDTFVDQPPSVAQGGRGVVVPGCPTCKKRFQTAPQFIDHIANDVLPKVLEKL